MELQQLKLFVTVAEEGHLTRAAERLFTSQPAVSAQLKSLEETLGVTLFQRTPKGMQLTAAGKELLSHAQSTLQAADNVINKAKSLKGDVAGSLTIGTNSDFSYLRIPSLVSEAKVQHPNLKLSFINSMSFDIIQDIRKGTLDSGFFFGPCSVPELQVIQLEEAETAIIIPGDWDDEYSRASMEELAKLPWIYTSERCPFFRLMQALLHSHQHEVEKVALVDTEDAIRECIKSGLGVALLRQEDAEKAESEGWGKRWLGNSPSITLNLAIKPNRMQEPLISAWLNTMSALWPDMTITPPRMKVV